MLAVLSGFTECVELLLGKGADPNLSDNAKNSALHYATINGYVEIIKLLLATKKIDTNQENRMAHTPVLIATAKGNATLLNILLGPKSTDPNLGSKINPIFVAIQNSNIECLKLLLDNNADPNQSVEGMTPLHRAVMLGDVPIIEMLLTYGADPLAQASFKIGDSQLKITPLGLVEISHALGLHSVPTQLLRCKAGANAIREAIAKGEITALKQLLAQYSDADVVNYQDKNGKTPLHWACEKEYVSCVKAVLVFYPSLALKDKDGNVAMAIARKHGNEEVKKELQRYENATRLLKEAAEGHESELKKILDGGDVDVEFTKPDKNTAVHLCAAYGFLNCLKLLLNTASQLACRANAEKQLPIHLAAERGHSSCVQELLTFTKPGGKVLHDELWSLAVSNAHRELIMWLNSDLCSNKDLPNHLFPAAIEIEYHFGDIVNFLTSPEDVSLYELEKQLYNKLNRYTILEQRLQQGRTQIRDDTDLKKAIATAKADQSTTNPTKGKVVVIFHCVQNLENRPIAQPPSGDNSFKPISKLRSVVDEKSSEAETTLSQTTTVASLSPEQFNLLKDFISDKFTPHQKELEKELKKISAHMKVNSIRSADVIILLVISIVFYLHPRKIYDEIQSIKANDRDFISAS